MSVRCVSHDSFSCLLFTVPYRKTRPRSRPKFRGFRADSRRTPAHWASSLPFRRPIGRCVFVFNLVPVSRSCARCGSGSTAPIAKAAVTATASMWYSVSLLLPPCRSPSAFGSRVRVRAGDWALLKPGRSGRLGAGVVSLPPAGSSLPAYCGTRAPFTGDLVRTCGRRRGRSCRERLSPRGSGC